MKRGFTLIEVLLVLTLVSILTIGGLSLDRARVSRRGARAAGETIAALLRHAQARAQAMVNDETWSVHIASDSAVVFEGASYAGRDAGEDRISAFAEAVVVAGTTDITFAKGTAVPASTASLSVFLGDERWHVRVNAEGMISHGAN